MAGARVKVAIIVYCLRGGGAERVSAYLANHLVARGHTVTVVTELAPETDQYALAKGVGRAVIGGGRGGGPVAKAWRMMRKVAALRGALRRADAQVAVSFMTRSNNLTLLATLRSGRRVVICERNDPRHNNERAGDVGLRRRLYPRADLLVVQTRTMATVMRDLFAVGRIATIPNPSVNDQAAEDVRGPRISTAYILAMGRMAPQKGFDVLIRAYARSRARNELDLVIAGQGGHLDWFESIARDEGVASRVHFLGHVDQPFPVLKGCRMFVLSSRWEGFPNVLLEAMSFGRPVISTILPSGAHDMIEDGVNGLLVPPGDDAALATAIDRLADDPDAAEAMGARGPEAVAPFALPVVMDRWETMLTGVVEGAWA